MASCTLDIERRFGPEAVRHLAGAYETVLTLASGGAVDRMPDRAVRSAIVQAMLVEGEASGFETARLASAGAAAFRNFRPG